MFRFWRSTGWCIPPGVSSGDNYRRLNHGRLDALHLQCARLRVGRNFAPSGAVTTIRYATRPVPRCRRCTGSADKDVGIAARVNRNQTCSPMDGGTQTLKRPACCAFHRSHVVSSPACTRTRAFFARRSPSPSRCGQCSPAGEAVRQSPSAYPQRVNHRRANRHAVGLAQAQ